MFGWKEIYQIFAGPYQCNVSCKPQLHIQPRHLHVGASFHLLLSLLGQKHFFFTENPRWNSSITHTDWFEHNYSVLAQANAQLGSWTQEAPEASSRSRKLEFLYFLPFVSKTAVILKSRSSRFPCCTAKQSLKIKFPNTCHHRDTNPVCETFLCHCHDLATAREAVHSLWCYFNSHFSSQPTAPEGHWCAFCTDSGIILMTIMRRSFLLVYF